MASNIKEVKQRVLDSINHNNILRNKLSQKLIHLKLKGREDIARDYRRLVSLKSAGVYYAVKAAQMRPLVEEKELLPSKEIQKRIEDIERDIFNTLSGGAVEHTPEEFSNFGIDDCMTALNNNYNKLQTALVEYEAVRKDLENPDEFTDEGFRTYEVAKRQQLRDVAATLKLDISVINKKVEEVQTLKSEDKAKFEQEKTKVQAKITDIKTKREEVRKLKLHWDEKRKNVSEMRLKRNVELCALRDQKKLILTQIDGLSEEAAEMEVAGGDKGIEAKRSLMDNKSDLETNVMDKQATLSELKREMEQLQLEEAGLISNEKAKKELLSTLASENQQLTSKITGQRNHDMVILRNLQNCAADIAADMDLDCTKWRNTFMSNIFEAGAVDIKLFQNKTFAQKDKYKKPDERYQINKALETEIKMIDIGINDLETRNQCVKDEIVYLNQKKASVIQQRARKDKASLAIAKKQEVLETKEAKLQGFLQKHEDTSKYLQDQLLTMLPRTELVENMSSANRALLTPILPKLNKASLVEDENVEKYNKIKAQLLSGGSSHPKAFAYQFLQEELKHQLQVENLLEKRVKRIELKNVNARSFL